MPFTLSHPIATAPIWWLSRRRLDLSALFIGSIMPDIAYFVHLRPVQNIGHSGYGAVMQGLPWGLVLLAIVQYGLKQPCLALLPLKVANRISSQPYRFFPLERLAVIIVSILVGDFSHIGWDAFTHASGWGVYLLPWLQNNLGPIALYKWLQYGGGILGLLSLGLWFGVWLTHTRPRAPKNYSFPYPLKLSIGIGLAIATILFTVQMLPVTEPPSVLLVRSIITLISGSCLSLCTYSAFFWVWKLCSSNN